jgi:hypothetical protein
MFNKSTIKNNYQLINEFDVEIKLSNKVYTFHTCGESATLNLLNYLLLDDNGIFIIPKNAIQKIKDFYKKYPNIKKMHSRGGKQVIEDWTLLISNIKNINYIKDNIELVPNIKNIFELFNYLIPNNYIIKNDIVDNFINLIKIFNKNVKTEIVTNTNEKVIIIFDDFIISMSDVHCYVTDNTKKSSDYFFNDDMCIKDIIFRNNRIVSNISSIIKIYNLNEKLFLEESIINKINSNNIYIKVLFSYVPQNADYYSKSIKIVSNATLSLLRNKLISEKIIIYIIDYFNSIDYNKNIEIISNIIYNIDDIINLEHNINSNKFFNELYLMYKNKKPLNEGISLHLLRILDTYLCYHNKSQNEIKKK